MLKIATSLSKTRFNHSSIKMFSQIQTQTQQPQDILIQHKLQQPYQSSLVIDFEMDYSNIINAAQPVSEQIPNTVLNKASQFGFTNIYNGFNDILEDIISYLVNNPNYEIGYGLAIVIVTLGIKTVYAPLTIGAQLNTFKMKLIAPETENHQAIIKQCQQNGDYKGLKLANDNFMKFRQEKGINMSIVLWNITQIPILISWFILIRYMTSLPEKYVGIRTDGFLWFQDLSIPDPYYILPILSACISYTNISVNIIQYIIYQQQSQYSQQMQHQTPIPMIRDFMAYLKYFPFITVPIVAFFPSGLNLYWCMMAGSQLFTQVLIINPTFRKMLGIGQYLPGTILEQQLKKEQANVIKTIIQNNIDNEQQNTHSSKIKVYSNNPKKKK